MFSARSLAQVLAGSILFTQASWAIDPVAERGFFKTKKGREMADRAIYEVNLLISDQGPRLTPSWKQSKRADDVPVYLVEGHSKAINTPAAVPRGCWCVFVSPSVLKAWIEHNSSGSGRLNLDAGRFLVFILMHEVGHINSNTPGAVFKDGEISQLNVEPSLAKVAEEEADDFAANILKSRAKQAKVNEASLTANWVIMELTNLSWNMQAFRTLDEFGSFAVGKPSVYFDIGYTHPNLAWRILRANDHIQQTEATRVLLEAFEEARLRGANPQPLYVKP